MDWLRSEDLKEEKYVTAPKNHYSSLCTLWFAEEWRGVLSGMHRITPEYFETDPVDRSLAADVSLREESDEEEDEEQDSNNDGSDDEYEGYSE